MARQSARRGSQTSGALALVADESPELEYLSEIERFARDLPEKFLLCRELGHNWKPYTASRFRDKDGGGFLRVLRCGRCRCERHQELSSRGIVLSNKYVHPEGYLHKGMGQIVGEGRGLLRLESITRTVQKSEG